MTEEPQIAVAPASGAVSLIHWVVRGLLIATAVTALVVALQSGGQADEPPAPEADVVVTLAAGDRYGQPAVWVGPVDEGTRTYDDATFQTAFQPALGEGKRVLIQVAPSIYQRHVHHTIELIRKTAGNDVSIVFQLME
jgi:hypothetical protein